MKNKRIILAVALLCVGLVGISYGAMTFMASWQTGVTLTVVSPKLEVYMDESCTHLIHSVSFGNIQQGARNPGGNEAIMYIRNEGNGTIILTWSSTIKNVSNGNIGDNWDDVGDKWLDPGQVIRTRYWVFVSPNCPTGFYTWELTLGVKD